MYLRWLLVSLLWVPLLAAAETPGADADRDILVTFENVGASRATPGGGAAYRFRKRYAVSAQVRRYAKSLASEYELVEVDHWPIKSLSIYCFVYRIPAGANRDEVIERLRQDVRVESAQPLVEFSTASGQLAERYDDTYAKLQHGLDILNVSVAHRYSTGTGVRIAIIDSKADIDHEDLRGRLGRITDFAESKKAAHAEHGTAVASVIGANANNARGIVGVAPGAKVDVFISCWEDAKSSSAVCNSFTLAKALDALLDNPPDILNMSLTGPSDTLVHRLLDKVAEAGVIIVAACASPVDASNHFPASVPAVIGVGSSVAETSLNDKNVAEIFAPGNQILVAVPDNEYDFRSGSSLAAAHVTGIVALLLTVSPDSNIDRVRELLQASQRHENDVFLSVNACTVLQLDDATRDCS